LITKFKLYFLFCDKDLKYNNVYIPNFAKIIIILSILKESFLPEINKKVVYPLFDLFKFILIFIIILKLNFIINSNIHFLLYFYFYLLFLSKYLFRFIIIKIKSLFSIHLLKYLNLKYSHFLLDSDIKRNL
jgi:hypothetical protein